MRLVRKLAAVAAALATMAVPGACSGGSDSDGGDHSVPDSLRVATLYSPTSYFIYREEQMGYDYTLLRQLADSLSMEVDLTVAPSLEAAMEMLDSGLVDLLAYEVPVTKYYKDIVAHCGPVTVTNQVLVQPRSDSVITDVTGLVGRDVYVENNSKYLRRLSNLNDELGGGIRIHTVDRDTLITEDLLQMVADGLIPLTVVDSDVARLNKTYYPQLDISLSLSFDQRSQWAVSRKRQWLADSIDSWFGKEVPQKNVDAVYKRYFEMAKSVPSAFSFDFSKGRISPYDQYFRTHARDLGWDWRLLASQGFVESRFDNSVTSWAGARGIMQIMPSTARANGVAPAELDNPETSVRIAVKVLVATDRLMRRYVSDPDERRLFVLAAYNSGAAHIVDAIELARKYGLNPSVWSNNVEHALLMKADPRYYNDPVVKYGYFRGRQTTEYVRQVMQFYKRSIKQVPL